MPRPSRCHSATGPWSGRQGSNLPSALDRCAKPSSYARNASKNNALPLITKAFSDLNVKLNIGISMPALTTIYRPTVYVNGLR